MQENCFFSDLLSTQIWVYQMNITRSEAFYDVNRTYSMALCVTSRDTKQFSAFLPETDAPIFLDISALLSTASSQSSCGARHTTLHPTSSTYTFIWDAGKDVIVRVFTHKEEAHKLRLATGTISNQIQKCHNKK